MPQHNPFAVQARLRRLQIEITTGCNLHCAGCQRTLGMAAGTWHNAHMPAQRFAAILANAPPADTIILQGIGEPTLHPALPQLITAARAAGKFGAISFNTNALVWDAVHYRALRTAGLDHVSVSVDSLDPQTSQATRAGTDCARLTESIQALTDLFGASVTLSIVLSRLNAAELPALLRQLHALGGRCIEVQPLVSYSPATQSLCLTAAELASASREIAEARTTLPDLHLLGAPALTPNGERCRRPLHAAYVTVDGFLTPCCFTNDAALFGRSNLAEASFATLWHCSGVAAWLNAYLGQQPTICCGCAFNPAGMSPLALEDAEQWLRQGNLDAAEARFRAIAIGDTARHAGALHGLGLVHLQRGDANAALPLLQAAYALVPEARYGHNLAVTLAALGYHDEAIAIAQTVVTAQAAYVPAQLGLARLLVGRDDARAAAAFAGLAERGIQAQRFDLAETCIDALTTLPIAADPRLRLANLLRCTGRQDLALRLLQPALDQNPNDFACRLVVTMSQLTAVHATNEEIASRRRAYTRELKSLDALTATAGQEALAAAIGQVGNAKPFFLAYQGEDDRDLQQTYGWIVSRITRAAHSSPALGHCVAWDDRGQSSKLRVGFASAYFHLHSISKLFGGWIRQLDRHRFDVFGYQFGTDVDAMSTSLAAYCTAYRRGTASATAWAAQIAEDRLDALIYPEIGMHPLPVQLGCLRLAPVQCAAWGHPVTSGLPEIDCFLSSALMEPPEADQHYTERLVRLPNLSISSAALPDRGSVLPRAKFGLHEDAVVYVCCQSLFKYLPCHDPLFPHIAALVPDAQFLFIGTSPPQIGSFRARLERNFAAAGLAADRHLRIVPPVSSDDFPALLRCADIYLDSIGWSGGNTTLEALACGLPVVTLPTGLMRGRHSAAILGHIGLGKRICADRADFVALAVRLADAGQRGDYEAAVRANRHKLYDDPAPVRALEAFLLDACHGEEKPRLTM